MLVNRLILILCLCGLPLYVFSQVQKSWSVMVAPGISHSKVPVGFGVGHPDSPYYVNLKLREPRLFAWRAEINRERISRKNWFISKGLGFSSYSFIIYYDYDREHSIANNISDRYDVGFVYGSLKAGRPFSVGKFSVTPYAGGSVNYLIRAKYTYTSIYRTLEFNELANHKRWTSGWEFGAMLGYRMRENLKFELRPCYSKVHARYGPTRRVYSWTAGIAVVKTFKKIT